MIGATVGATIVTALLLWMMALHRSGRISFLRRASEWAEAQTGTAGWSSLPGITLAISLITAVFGMYWDISIHVDNGRDPGPLANPAHYFILVGLYGVMFSGVLSVVLTEDKPSDIAKRLSDRIWAPLGAIMIVSCGAVSLIAFPLDDIWHRLFGQDVTLWGPTHLLLIGGASFSILGQWVLQAEGRHGRGEERPTLVTRSREIALAGSLLVGLSTFQAEFDFGVPQFRLVWQPLLLALAAGIGLVAARVRLGRGGALGAALFFIGLRGLLALLVGPILGQTTPHFPLYLAEAAIVELVALRYGRRQPIMLGAVSGLLIGTVGFAAEYGWAAAIAYIPWPTSLIAEGVVCATIAGIAGGILGGFIGRSVTPRPPAERVPRWLVPAAGVAAVAVMAWALPMPNGTLPRAKVALADVGGGPHRHVLATARLNPPDAARDARWFVVTAWQGGGAVVARMHEIAPGVYRAARPVPAYGDSWKSTLRLQRGRAVLGMPIYMPADPAIPVKGIPAARSFTRSFERDKKLLQREQKKGVSGALWAVGYVAVLLIWSAMIAIVGWGLATLARSIGAVPPRSPRGRAQARARSRPSTAT